MVSHASDGQGGVDSSGSGMAVTEVILLNTSMCRWPKKEGKDPPVTGKGTKVCSFPHHGESSFPHHGESETFIFRPCTAEK